MSIHQRECEFHNGSMCMYEYESTVPGVGPFRRCRKHFDSKDLLLASIYAECVSKYVMKDHKVVARRNHHFEAYLNFYRRYFTSKSAISIRPVIKQGNPIVETNIYPATFIRKIVSQLSQEYIAQAAQTLCYTPGTLAHRCIEVLNWEKIVYEAYTAAMDFKGNPVGNALPRVFFSTNNMTCVKQMRMLEGFSHNTARRGESFMRIRKLLPGALQAMHSSLKTDSFVGTVRVLWDPREVLKWVNLSTGGGLTIGKSGKFTINDVEYVVHDTGKKVFLIESSIRAVHKFVIAVLKGENAKLLDLEIMREKQEWRKATAFSEEDLKKLMEKLREFFCPSLNMIIFSDFLMRDRRKIETGNMIRIGMGFNWGGAWQLAKYLHYDDENYFWVDGDVSQLDKNIQDWMLMLYIACGSRYYAWQEYDDEAKKKKIEYFVKTLMYKISHKIVLHLGGFWQFMRGVMHSGGKDTSHGDSWIMALMFYLYCMDVIDRNPHLSDIIMHCLVTGIIAIVVYGDDHVWASLKVLRPYMNAKGWVDFLARVCHMTLRGAKEYDKFLSTVNLVTGTYTYLGVVFLKRRFIESFIEGSAPVLPFKEINETMVNLFLKEQNADMIDYFLSCIGQMYDTMGTNVVAYHYVYRFFDIIKNYYALINPQDALKIALEDPERRLKVMKYMRRVHMTDTDILKSVPSLKKLQSWHVYDADKCRYGGKLDEDYLEFAF